MQKNSEHFSGTVVYSSELKPEPEDTPKWLETRQELGKLACGKHAGGIINPLHADIARREQQADDYEDTIARGGSIGGQEYVPSVSFEVPDSLNIYNLRDIDEWGDLKGLEKRWAAGASAVSNRSVLPDELHAGKKAKNHEDSSIVVEYSSAFRPDDVDVNSPYFRGMRRRGFRLSAVLHEDGCIDDTTFEIGSKKDPRDVTIFTGESPDELTRICLAEKIATVAAIEGFVPKDWKELSVDYGNVKNFDDYGIMLVEKAFQLPSGEVILLEGTNDGFYLLGLRSGDAESKPLEAVSALASTDAASSEAIQSLVQEWYEAQE